MALAALALAIVGCESSHTTLEDWLAKIDWFPTMRRQPSIEAYEEPRLPAEGTLPIDAEFALSLTEAERITASPLAASAVSLERGRTQYGVFCAVCHGPEGSGGGSVAVLQTGFPPGLIPSLTADRARALTDGYLYGMIVNGRGLMPSYRRIPEEDRWHIVNHLRELQRRAIAAPAGGGGEGGAGGAGAAGAASAQSTGSEAMRRAPTWLTVACALAAVAGALTLVVAARGASADRAWQIYLVNFLYWTGLATGGVLFGLVLQIAKGHWGKPLRRLPLAFGAFLPVSYVLFFILALGCHSLFPWIEETTTREGFPIRTGWLNMTGVFARGGFFLFLLYGLLLAFLYYEARPDLRAVAGTLSGWRSRLVARWTRGFRGEAEEAARSRRILGRMSALTAIFLCIVVSGMAIDLIMSLEPGWISVLFPMYFVVGAWLEALALTAILAATVGRRWALGLEPRHFHDLGKLTFAFCVFWAYLWFSQLLPIWYGNLPRETIFLEKRWVEPWTGVSVAFFALVFVVPFMALLGKKPKMTPPFFAGVAGLILVGLYLERYESVVASIWTAPSVPFGVLEGLITLGFAGLFGLACLAYWNTVPPVPRNETIAIGQPRKGP